MSSNDIFSQARSAHGVPRKMGPQRAALLLTGSLVGWTAAGSGVGNVAAAPTRPRRLPRTPAASRTIGARGDSYAPSSSSRAPAVVTIRSEHGDQEGQPGFARRSALPAVLRRPHPDAGSRRSVTAGSAPA